MIKFFRKIRQKMLNENKFSKYLIYAIGEIILVVIGILIALQINNWNDRRKIFNEESNLISGLIRDLKADAELLKNVIDLDSSSLYNDKILLEAFEIDSIRNNKEQLKYIIINSSFDFNFTPTRNVYDEIINNGKISYISIDSIKMKIKSYYSDISGNLNIFNKNDLALRNLTLKINSFIDFNSSIQPMLPDYAKKELGDFDNTFFYHDIQSNGVQEFANLISSRQALRFISMTYNKQSYEDANKLIKELTNYRNEK